MSASVQAVLHALPERSVLGGVQRKRVELLTMRLAAHRPVYHLLPTPEEVSSEPECCVSPTHAELCGSLPKCTTQCRQHPSL